METKEFKPKTEIGQKVTYIEINLRSDSDKLIHTSINKQGVHVDEYKIVFQTERKIALSNKWITTIDRLEKGERKSKHWNYLNDAIVTIKTNESYFPNGVFGHIYTTGKVNLAIKNLTKAMQEKVNKEYGFLANINIESEVSKYI